MKFLVTKASDWNWQKTIEIKSLAALKRLQDRYHCELIVDFAEMQIILYDDYVE